MFSKSYIFDWLKNAEDINMLREMETSGEMRTISNNVSAVMAKLTEVESLAEAFQGCRGVFHTSSFTDPAGLSGYSVSLATLIYSSVLSLSPSTFSLHLIVHMVSGAPNNQIRFFFYFYFFKEFQSIMSVPDFLSLD